MAVIHPPRAKVGAERIVLIGTPERLTGIVRVSNPGNDSTPRRRLGSSPVGWRSAP